MDNGFASLRIHIQIPIRRHFHVTRLCATIILCTHVQQRQKNGQTFCLAEFQFQIIPVLLRYRSVFMVWMMKNNNDLLNLFRFSTLRLENNSKVATPRPSFAFLRTFFINFFKQKEVCGCLNTSRSILTQNPGGKMYIKNMLCLLFSSIQFIKCISKGQKA